MRCWAVIALLASATPAVAGPSVSESLTHYAISGNNLSDLRQEMAQNGPKGFWGYTRWWINWSGSCKVNLEIRITLPKLSASAALTPSEERIWNTMVDALYRHEPTFPKWPAVRCQSCLNLPSEQAFSTPSGVCGRAYGWSWADEAAKRSRCSLAAVFFSAADRPVLSLSFSLGVCRSHARSGGARRQRMAARIARTIGPVTATSASWKVMARA